MDGSRIPRAGRWRSSEHLHYYICIIIIQYISYNDIMWTGRATQQFWKSTTQKSALAKGTVATLPPRKIFLCFFPDQYIFHFLFQHFNNDLQELHLCDCRPVHHGSWLPVTLDHPHLSNGGQSNLSRAETESSKHTKTFPRKTAVTTRQICSISDPAFKWENLRLFTSPLAVLPSLPNCYQPKAWVFVVQLGCET